MADNDKQYPNNDSFYDPERSNRGLIEQILSSFMNPALAEWLGGAIKGGLKGYVNEGSGFFGMGVSSPLGLPGMPFSQGAMFGPTNAAHSMYSAMQRENMKDVQESVRRADNAMRSEWRMQAARVIMPGMSDAERERRMMSGGLTLFNMGADWLLDEATGAQDFQKFANYTALQAGTAPLAGLTGRSRDLQMQRNMEINDAIGTMTSLQMRDAMELYGISGNNAGRLMAEVARTGGFNAFGGRSMSQNVTRTMAQWASTVEPMSAFFGNNVQAGMDASSSLLGVSALPTFGAELGDMYRGLRATGRVTGLSNAQMLTLAAQSSQYAAANDMERFSAISNAQTSAMTFRAAIQTPGALRYVNEQGLRESIVQRVTGAGGSDLARVISGAAAGMTEKARESFFTRLQERTIDSADDVVRAAGGGSVEAFLAASYTSAAKDVRATGLPAEAVMRGNVNTMSDLRRDALERIAGRRAAAGINSMTEQGLAGLDQATQGRVIRVWESMARDMGYENAAAVDAVIRGSMEGDLIKQYAARSGMLADMDSDMAKYSRRGLTSSLKNALADAAGGGAKGEKALTLLNVLRGPDAEKLDAAAAKALGEDVTKLTTIYNKMKKADEAGKIAPDAMDSTTFGRGTELIIQGIVKGSINGKAVDSKKREEWRRRIKEGDEQGVVNEVINTYDPTFAQNKRLGGLARATGLDVVKDRKALETLDVLNTALADTDFNDNAFREEANELARALADPDYAGDIEAARESVFGSGRKGKIAYKKFAESMNEYIATDEDAKGLKTGAFGVGSGDMLTILKDILTQLSLGIDVTVTNPGAPPSSDGTTPGGAGGGRE